MYIYAILFPLCNVSNLFHWLGDLVWVSPELKESAVYPFLTSSFCPSYLFLPLCLSPSVFLCLPPSLPLSLPPLSPSLPLSHYLLDYDIRYDERNDIWSLGCIIMEMACCGHLNVHTSVISNIITTKLTIIG